MKYTMKSGFNERILMNKYILQISSSGLYECNVCETRSRLCPLTFLSVTLRVRRLFVVFLLKLLLLLLVEM